jgi:hypothetical protein
VAQTGGRRDADAGAEGPMSLLPSAGSAGLDRHSLQFYRRALELLEDRAIAFLVGGAYAFERYTGIARHTKDLDLFIRRQDHPAVMAAFAACGYPAELTFPHWLGKVACGDCFVDIIFSSGNGLVDVDDGWFEHAPSATVLGVAVRLCPAEEMIWSKAFVMERERYDGADIAHILRAEAASLDWDRLLERFGAQWRVLLSHLVLFGFVYPSHRALVPERVMRTLMRRLEAEVVEPPPSLPICQGTLISREQYLPDLRDWGYQDARLMPHGTMTEEETERWTRAIEEEQ